MKPWISAKESNISAKKTRTSAKEPYISARGSCISAKEPSIPPKEHYICTKESNVSVKGPKIIGWKGQLICKSAPNICQPTCLQQGPTYPQAFHIWERVHIRKRAWYIHETALHIHKRAEHIRKRALNMCKSTTHIHKRALLRTPESEHLSHLIMHIRKTAIYINKRALSPTSLPLSPTIHVYITRTHAHTCALIPLSLSLLVSRSLSFLSRARPPELTHTPQSNEHCGWWRGRERKFQCLTFDVTWDFARIWRKMTRVLCKMKHLY